MKVNRHRSGDKLNLGTTCTKYTLFLLNIVFVNSIWCRYPRWRPKLTTDTKITNCRQISAESGGAGPLYSIVEFLSTVTHFLANILGTETYLTDRVGELTHIDIVSLDYFFLKIASGLVILSGVTTIVAFTSYNNLMPFGFDTLTRMWLIVGIIFMIAALLGIFAAFKESTAVANLYGMAMTVVVIMQIGVSIYSFTLISQTYDMVSMQLNTMMSHYSNEYRLEIDWIQSKFECCGNNDPKDWQNFERFATTLSYDYIEYELVDHYLINEAQDNETDLMPISCCVLYSNYVGLRCAQHHKSGCFEPIHQIVSASVMMIGTSGLIFSVVQILGIILGFAYARIIRSKKTQRYVRIWNSTDQGNPISGSQQTHADYSPVKW